VERTSHQHNHSNSRSLDIGRLNYE